MELIATTLTAAVFVGFVAYAALWSNLPTGVRYYLRVALILLAGNLALSLLRASGIVPAGVLLDLAIIAFLLVLSFGFLLTLAVERREQRELRLLRSAASLLTPSTELGELLEQILDIVHAAVRVDGSSIMLLDPASRDLTFGAVRGIDLERARSYRVSLDHPAAASLWPGSGPLIIPDVRREPALQQLLVTANARAVYAIPMVTRDTLVGFLNVHRDRVSAPTPEEIEVLKVLASHAAVAIYQARLYADLQQRYFDTIGVLASAIEVNDPSTLGHSRNVAAIARLIAGELGLEDRDRETLEVAALLHDVGKIGISNGVLHKLGQLSREERDEVRSHSVLGSQVLREVETLRDIIPAVLHHHERWDGRGYPSGLKGEEIPLLARIVAAADAYEVMTAGRAYRGARRPEAAMAEMRREAGRQFDPAVVDAMVRLFERGELGQVALLASRPFGRDRSETAAAS